MLSQKQFFISALFFASSAFGADLSRVARDWPMQRHDAGRTRVTDETLSFPMRCLWRYLPAQPPRPAWPEPPRLRNQMDFDYAPVPVIADNTLYFGSSADDTLRAMDARTGALKWQFTAGGPIRFAPAFVPNATMAGKPQLAGGRLYFAADDGLIYCLQAANGAVVWTFNAAPANEQFIGNRRMISRWPIRTGVLVADGLVYAVAGIWPSEGIYVYALDADTGKVVWLNDTDSFGLNPRAGAGGDRWSIGDPHMGEFSVGGLTPQGALLATPNTLLVPLANNAAARFNIKSGRLNGFSAVSAGSSTPFLDGVMCYTFLGSSGTDDTLFSYVIAGEGVPARVVQYSGTNLLPAGTADNRESFQDRLLKHAPGDARVGPGKVDAIVSGGKRYVRRAGGLALTANALLVGQRDEIVAEDRESAAPLWRAPVNGLAREIAVADGRVYVATDTGEISCFMPASAGSGTTLVHDARAEIRPWRSDQTTPGVAAVVAELKRRQADAGVALVLGDADGAMSAALAAYTSLHVLNVSSHSNKVASLRARLLRETAWYGSHIHVIYVPDLRRLPFAQYFANAVIVAGLPVGLEPGLSGKELYRVLHPYGGVLMCPGLEKADAEALMRECDAYEVASHAQSLQAATEPTPPSGHPSKEGISTDDPLQRRGGPDALRDRDRGGFPFFVRGALPGARNWNTQPATDQRVKWPLRPLWFGGPDPVQVMNVAIGAHPPVAAQGRYFVTGDDCLTAVDAYNGMTLWSRPIPPAVLAGVSSDYRDQWGAAKRFLAADDHHVYLRLGSNWFQGRSEVLIRLDAYSGAQQSLYGPYLAPTNILLTMPQQRIVAWDEAHTGKVTLSHQSDGIVLTFASPEAMAPSLSWDACFDFRDVERRYGLYDDGAFALMLTPPLTNGAPAKAYQVTGQRFPEYTLRSGSQKGVSELSLIFPWSALEKFLGRRPVSFDLAVAGVWQTEKAGLPAAAMIRAWQAAVPTSRPNYVFGDGAVRYLNCGWARVILSGMPGAKKPPAILLGELAQRPKDWLFPEVHDRLTIQDPGELSPAYQTAARAHPLTGEPGPRVYRSGTGGCGFPVYSAHSVIGRSTKTAIGFYDFMDDSGLRFFFGPGPNCAVQTKAQNMTAALGVLIFSEGRGHCDCMVPIRTSLAFAPAERRLQEDWAVFFDHNIDAPLRQAAVNFGAPGDRRDEQGTLWLGYPRQSSGKAYPREPGSARYVIQSPPIASSIDLPLKVTGFPRFTGYERLNADSTRIEGTDRPWLYASCLRGVTNLIITLEPVSSLLAGAAQTQPALDGRLEESFWQTNDFRQVLSFTGTRVALRFDEKHLYIGAYRLSLVDDKGQPAAWVSATKGLDAPIDQDDSMEFFLSDKANAVVIHLGVAASGARYDALAQGREPERAAWNGEWHSAARADESEFAVEMAIPWTTIKAAGLDKTSLALNLQVNQKNMSAEIPVWAGDLAPKRKEGISAPLLSLGPQGRSRCANFVPLGLGQPASVRPRLFTVRLHFADLREKADVPRVFDVLLQGKTVLNNFNIAREAGGPRKAIVKEFQHVSATEKLTLEFSASLPAIALATAGGGPAGVKPTHDTVPLLSGLEVLDESFAVFSASK